MSDICKAIDSPRVDREVSVLLGDGRFEEAASLLVTEYGVGRFERKFTDAFSQDKLDAGHFSDGMRRLPALFDGAVVTTNFDRALETVYQQSGNPFRDYVVPRRDDCSELLSRIKRRDAHYLVKLHGDADNFRSRVLTKEEYDTVYGDLTAPDLKPFPKALAGLFEQMSFLFLGCSLDKDRTLDVLKLQAGKGDIENYAFLELPDETICGGDKHRAILKNPETGEWWDALRKKEKNFSDHRIFPIWYPRGQYEAVAVLLDKLLEASGKVAATATVSRHPYGFWGRDDLVRDIVGVAKENTVLCVYGLPGIGKTEVCAEVMQRLKDNYPNAIQTNVLVQGVWGYEGFLRRFAKTLGLDGEKEIKGLEENLLHALSTRAKNVAQTIYLDNFEDALTNRTENQPEGGNDIRAWEFIARCAGIAGVRILLSCREKVTGSFLWKEVRPLDPKNARLLFHNVWEKSGGNMSWLEAERDVFDDILTKLAGHPLSIVLMASQACEVASLRQLYENWARAYDAPVDISPSENQLHYSLNAAVKTSYARSQTDITARTLWGIISLVPDDLCRSTMRAIVPDKDVLDQAIRKLLRLNLMRWSERADQEEALTMLAPIRRQVFGYVTPDEPGGEAHSAQVLKAHYTHLLSAAWPDRENWNEAWHNVLQVLDDIFYLLRCFAENHQWMLFAELSGDMENFYQFRVVTADALLDAFGLQILNGTVSLPSQRKAPLWKSMGVLKHLRGQVKEAMNLYERAKTLYEQQQNDLGLAHTLRNMGDLKRLRGQVDEAMNLYEQAKPLYEQEQSDLGLANTLRSMGDLKCYLRQVDEAMDLYEQAKLLYEQRQDNLGLAHTLQGMGDLKHYTGQVDEATTLYERAMTLFEQQQDDQGLANTLQSMGDLKRRVGQAKEAMNLYERAKTLYEQRQDNLGLANTYVGIGLIAWADKIEPQKGIDLLLLAQALYKKVQAQQSIERVDMILKRILDTRGNE